MLDISNSQYPWWLAMNSVPFWECTKALKRLITNSVAWQEQAEICCWGWGGKQGDKEAIISLFELPASRTECCVCACIQMCGLWVSKDLFVFTLQPLAFLRMKLYLWILSQWGSVCQVSAAKLMVFVAAWCMSESVTLATVSQIKASQHLAYLLSSVMMEAVVSKLWNSLTSIQMELE